MRRGSIANILIATLILLALIQPAFPSPVIIDDDNGGNVDTFRMWYKRLADSGAPVVLRGICVSACTFILSLPKSQVCVEPTASLGFHTWSTGREPDQSYTDAGARRLYPIVVQKWLAAQVAMKPWPITFMTADEMVSLGVFAPCPVEPPQE